MDIIIAIILVIVTTFLFVKVGAYVALAAVIYFACKTFSSRKDKDLMKDNVRKLLTSAVLFIVVLFVGYAAENLTKKDTTKTPSSEAKINIQIDNINSWDKNKDKKKNN